ncbi:hypothetical protein A2U01_0102357, partial [Trifolium medium]|nr:hypothetical protein [Trifolium medium]
KANAGSGPKNTEGIQDNVASRTSDFGDRSEKEKTSENVVHVDASETSTAVNSPSESVNTALEVVEVIYFVWALM